MQLEAFYFSRLEGGSLYDRHDEIAIHLPQKVNTTSPKAIIIIIIVTELDYQSVWKYQF